MSDLIKEISEPSRRSILLELKSGPLSVSDLVQRTGLKQPNVSNHLAKLKGRGVVRATKLGRTVYYSVAAPEILDGLMNQGAVAEPEISLPDACREYTKMATQGDEEGCRTLVDHLVNYGVDLIDIYQDVLAESMHFVGKWYVAEAIDEGQEHLASAITERMMARLCQNAQAPHAGAKVAVLGCIPGNNHTIGLRMISDFLQLNGWRIIFLGSNVPVRSFLSAIREHQPKMVLVSVASSDREEQAREFIESVLKLRQTETFELWAGGGMVLEKPEFFQSLGVDRMATTLRDFARHILAGKRSTRKA